MGDLGKVKRELAFWTSRGFLLGRVGLIARSKRLNFGVKYLTKEGLEVFFTHSS